MLGVLELEFERCHLVVQEATIISLKGITGVLFFTIQKLLFVQLLHGRPTLIEAQIQCLMILMCVPVSI